MVISFEWGNCSSCDCSFIDRISTVSTVSNQIREVMGSNISNGWGFFMRFHISLMDCFCCDYFCITPLISGGL